MFNPLRYAPNGNLTQIRHFHDGDPGVPEGPPGNSVPERPTDPEEDNDLINSQWPIYPDDLG